jgi:hypothetical protein
MVETGQAECLQEIEAGSGSFEPFTNLALPINPIPHTGMTDLL